jgi:hypothetical protein
VPTASEVEVPVTAAAPTPATAAVPLERVAVIVIGEVSVLGELAMYAPLPYSVMRVLSALTATVYAELELTVIEPPEVEFAPLEFSVHEEIVEVGVLDIETVLLSDASIVCVDADAATGIATARATTAATMSLRIFRASWVPVVDSYVHRRRYPLVR